MSVLLDRLNEERLSHCKGGLYHKLQVVFAYNSCRIEGSRLSEEQTRLIYETRMVANEGTEALSVDDIIETTNHFRAFDWVLEHAMEIPSEQLLFHLHTILKQATTDSQKSWFAVGAYKRLPNEVGGQETTPPEKVALAIKELLDEYIACSEQNLETLLDFHVRFERIHPFQDGNGRVGRLLLFKECLRCGVLPFVITDELKIFYYRGLQQWSQVRGYLTDTCRTAQDEFRRWLAYFRIDCQVC